MMFKSTFGQSKMKEQTEDEEDAVDAEDDEDIAEDEDEDEDKRKLWILQTIIKEFAFELSGDSR